MKIKYKVTVEMAVFEIKKNKVTVKIAVSVSVILITR